MRETSCQTSPVPFSVLRAKSCLGARLLSCVLLLAISSFVHAQERRVTVPLALPFQQAAHSSGESASSTAAYAIKSTTFTQSVPIPAAPPVTAPSSAPAVQASIQATSAAANVVAAPVKAASKPAPAKPAAEKPVLAAQPKAVAAIPVKLRKPAAPTLAIKAAAYPEGNREAFVREFENYVAQQIAPYVPGVAVAIISEGKIKSLQAFGVKTAGTRDKITPDTLFRLASVSKTIASTTTALAVAEGKLSWDMKIVNELKEVQFKTPKYGNQITLRHLISQSTGLPTHTYSHFIDANMAYAETVRRLRYVNFVCPPGKCYAYQNVTYSLAGELIKKKTGGSYENYVEKKLFDPLGMTSASFGYDSFMASRDRAVPHVASGKRWVPTSVTGNWYHVPPAAGANASIADMAQFMLGQLGRKPDVLSSALLNQIQTRVTQNTPAQNHYGTRKGVGNTAYGLGWRVFDYGRFKNFNHHGGWVKGFRSEMVFNRELQIGMVLLTNSETRRARDVIFKFMDMHERAADAARKAR